MSCYRPMIRCEEKGIFLTAKDGHKYQKPKIFTTKYIEQNLNYKPWENPHYTNYQLIPCGKCIGCRLDYSREWADRAYLEMTEVGKEKCYFLTLTYDKNHLPKVSEITTSQGITYTEDDAFIQGIKWAGNLQKKDLKKFFNHLRKIMERNYNQKKGIRYLAAGEYGSKDRRPHYHAIIFNIYLPAESFYSPKIINGQMHYKNKIIEQAWSEKGKPKGFIDITEATWNTGAYVGRYICKKLYGELAEDERALLGQKQEEFMVASNRPPLGKKYYDKHKKEIYENDQIMIKKKDKIEYHKPPMYFDFLYQKEYPEKWEKIKERRLKDAKNATALKKEKTSLNQWDILQLELDTKLTNDKQLIRPL